MRAYAQEGFADRLRLARKRTGLNQLEFGEMGGVKRVSQHFYETGSRLPGLAYVYRLADHGIDIVRLILGDPEQQEGETTISLKVAVAAFNATLAATQPPHERAALFASLCRSLSATLAAPPPETP